MTTMTIMLAKPVPVGGSVKMAGRNWKVLEHLGKGYHRVTDAFKINIGKVKHTGESLGSGYSGTSHRGSGQYSPSARHMGGGSAISHSSGSQGRFDPTKHPRVGGKFASTEGSGKVKESSIHHYTLISSEVDKHPGGGPLFVSPQRWNKLSKRHQAQIVSNAQRKHIRIKLGHPSKFHFESPGPYIA